MQFVKWKCVIVAIRIHNVPSRLGTKWMYAAVFGHDLQRIIIAHLFSGVVERFPEALFAKLIKKQANIIPRSSQDIFTEWICLCLSVVDTDFISASAVP